MLVGPRGGDRETSRLDADEIACGTEDNLRADRPGPESSPSTAFRSCTATPTASRLLFRASPVATFCLNVLRPSASPKDRSASIWRKDDP